jgi:hypothetical protein
MFKSPDELRKFVLDISSRIRAEGLIKQAEILEHRANLVCTTGQEWLRELGEGVKAANSLGSIPKDVEDDLLEVMHAATSPDPYADS